MVWSHYANETRLLETNYSSDEEYDDQPYDQPYEYQDWMTQYSDDLLNTWNGINGYIDDRGIKSRFLNDLTWNDFCEFCYKFSNRL